MEKSVILTKTKMEPNIIADDKHFGPCEICKKDTLWTILATKQGHAETGLLDSVKIECQECGFSFWV